jgi:hypothetical protein
MSEPPNSLKISQQTVVERKQHFLQSRKHYLSRGIVPSDKLKQIVQDGGIALSELKGVLDKGTSKKAYVAETGAPKVVG